MSQAIWNRRDWIKSAGALAAVGLGPAAMAQKPITVGFIYVGPRDDYGYNQAQAESVALVKKMPGIKVIDEENVPETNAVQKAMQGMIAQDGATLLFPTSYGYFDPHTLAVAAFSSCSRPALSCAPAKSCCILELYSCSCMLYFWPSAAAASASVSHWAAAPHSTDHPGAKRASERPAALAARHGTAHAGPAPYDVFLAKRSTPQNTSCWRPPAPTAAPAAAACAADCCSCGAPHQ